MLTGPNGLSGPGEAKLDLFLGFTAPEKSETAPEKSETRNPGHLKKAKPETQTAKKPRPGSS